MRSLTRHRLAAFGGWGGSGCARLLGRSAADGLAGALLALELFSSDDSSELIKQGLHHAQRVFGLAKLEGEAAGDDTTVLDSDFTSLSIDERAHLDTGAVAEATDIDVHDGLLLHDTDVVLQKNLFSMVPCNVGFVVHRDQPQSVWKEQVSIKYNFNSKNASKTVLLRAF